MTGARVDRTTDHGTTPAVAVPPIVDREAWQASRDELLVREKAHTREGDAIAAARRRLPMTEVDATITVIGPDGPRPLLDLFDGREELVVYKHMWHPGEPPENQCEGCTLTYFAVQDPAYLHARGVSFAVFAKAPYEELEPFVEFMGYPHHWYSVADVEDEIVSGEDFGTWTCFLRHGDRVFLTNTVTGRGAEATMPALALLDMTVRGRVEAWQGTPEGWPDGKAPGWFWRAHEDGVGNEWTGGRPTIQWSRPGAGAVTSEPHRHH
ncbi:DUF899 family protein [Pseudonocardia kunmingensis]|uniref:Putative dithiol-disulfide oxidoreductase (DUF899 family) n=1 Tax=Pseudonocardia kunmingensis TaxID=630975 RepID=A0A543DAY3_9PSEU|nr:DUF899 family protein [Pseudonocardia kunmingensis]TQM06497.1 putative dithiol-disulfide oxidoreductase (DUF899 family) [Pseudonocardia kunmingensis]